MNVMHTSWHRWTARLTFPGLWVGGLGLWWLSGEFTLAEQALLWGGVTAAVAALVWLAGANVFGPVLLYDMIRTGRRGRNVLVRFLLGGILFAILVWIYCVWHLGPATEEHPVTRSARIAESYFATFMTVQILAVLLLTPAFTAGAIAEEKDRRTLEFILATDLHNQEIVLSKLASRLLNLTLILLVGLPILSLLQFLGGVDPELVLAAYLATVLTMTSLASVSLLLSVYGRKMRDVLALVYLGTTAYLVLLPLLELYLRHGVAAVGAVPLWFGEEPPTLLGLVETLNQGNVFMANFRLTVDVLRGGQLAASLESVLRDYVSFHVALTIVCTTWAVLRLRAVALAQANEPAGAESARGRRWRWRPAVGNQPMLWKELFAEPGWRLGRAGRIIIGLLVLLSFVPAAWMVYDRHRRPSGIIFVPDPFQHGMRDWVQSVGTIVGCLLLLSVAVRASGSVTGERDRHTMDSLFASPLESGAMYFAKWWGSIWSVRRGLLWLGAIWVLAWWCGGLHLYGMLLLAVAWSVLAMLFAAVGVWYSVSSQTTTRATVMTLLVTLFFGGLNWLVAVLCIYTPLALALRHISDAQLNRKLLDNIIEFHAYGLTPPAMLTLLAFDGSEFGGWRSQNFLAELTYTVFGLMVAGVITFALYSSGSERLRILAGREPTARKWRSKGSLGQPACAGARSSEVLCKGY